MSKIVKITVEYEDGTVQVAKDKEAERWEKNIKIIHEFAALAGTKPFLTNPVEWTIKKKKKK